MNPTIASTGQKEFDFKDGNCAVDWKNWLRGFELCAMASGIEADKEKKKNWLLHFAGQKVQKIYFNLPEKQNEKEAKNGNVAAKEAKDEYHKAVS